jgi:hypothetical protein
MKSEQAVLPNPCLEEEEEEEERKKERKKEKPLVFQDCSFVMCLGIFS